jgi:hypothetical protein
LPEPLVFIAERLFRAGGVTVRTRPRHVCRHEERAAREPFSALDGSNPGIVPSAAAVWASHLISQKGIADADQ